LRSQPSVVAIDCPQEGTDRFGRPDGSQMLRVARRQSAVETIENVCLRTSGNDGVSKSLITVSQYSTGRIVSVLLLKSPEALQHIHGCHFADGHVANPREHICFKATDNPIAM